MMNISNVEVGEVQEVTTIFYFNSLYTCIMLLLEVTMVM